MGKSSVSMVNPDNGHQIRGNPGRSAYFRGGFNDYGRYAWNIKFYGFESEFEIEDAQRWALGEHMPLKATCDCKGYDSCKLPRRGARGFEGISELLGRPIESYTAGRSGGWLVIDSELTEEELTRVDAHVSACMAALPDFLKEEREFRRSEQESAEQVELATRASLENNPRLSAICAQIRDIAGADAVLIIKGIRIDVSTGRVVKEEE